MRSGPGRSGGRWTRSSPKRSACAECSMGSFSANTTESISALLPALQFWPPILERWFLRASFFSKATASFSITGGQELGESGATGRVTGPHLHVSVLWRGVALDLLSLTMLQAPDWRPEPTGERN